MESSVAGSPQTPASSMIAIDARLQAPENSVSGASTSAALRAALPAPVPPGQGVPRIPVIAPYSLASALSAPPSGKPFFFQAANISSRLKVEILVGKDVILLSPILPSPECDKAIATGGISPLKVYWSHYDVTRS